MGPHEPVGVPGEELVQVGGQDCSLVVTYLAVIIVSENPLEAINLSYFHFTIVISVLIEVSIAHNLFYGTSGAKLEDCPCSCSFLLIHFYRNVSFSFFMARQTAGTVWHERINKKYHFIKLP